MKLQTLKKKKKGFTLLELLVVLAILAILIAIAIPVYKNQKEKAAITAHNANVRVLETALESYRQDKGKLPDDINELATGGYIKSVPAVPSSNDESLKNKKYSINKTTGEISPAEIHNDNETDKTPKQ
ncbi:MAG: prepilin-type N-terminal cleavage/methylation domain-containing protein [Finegoldia magna]|uniref:prepilin-type N-terminal cleavage/methylation domain-containing protein n=1 Tax=Finegoldia TaxID=150022 RepID=UPI000B919BF6|nr:prepilin-type N-terminal cleavage/methylation domain-containing protein [Finegoldia magna]MDU5201346.1 prepilin-type N-terminal cleavage/methylation domain-containing protein [Finegoldia magna]MDU5214405.1 prepilin-type N-terminal cleavage/methylation domain-containing protein [Finegoldia magna]MDU6775951.1 prepilin-type N-terminal cleavage/methylation domain-containing protein [Finegoldia magna]OXZ25698.1 pilus assembly protein PilA [Finegoldia magna]